MGKAVQRTSIAAESVKNPGDAGIQLRFRLLGPVRPESRSGSRRLLPDPRQGSFLPFRGLQAWTKWMKPYAGGATTPELRPRAAQQRQQEVPVRDGATEAAPREECIPQELRQSGILFSLRSSSGKVKRGLEQQPFGQARPNGFPRDEGNPKKAGSRLRLSAPLWCRSGNSAGVGGGVPGDGASLIVAALAFWYRVLVTGRITERAVFPAE